MECEFDFFCYGSLIRFSFMVELYVDLINNHILFRLPFVLDDLDSGYSIAFP